jgi:CSLREA domain-containing protein
MSIRCLFAICLLAFPLISQGATFVVNSIFDGPDSTPGDGVCATADPGPPRCTLRAAIMEANGGAAVTIYTIEFSVGGFGIIIEDSPLPTINRRVTIDGRTAPGYSEADTVLASPPSIWISGASLSDPQADGLRVSSIDLFQVFALGIVGFPDNGIELVDAVRAEISGNWIGIQPNGNVLGNGGSGIWSQGCDRCRFGSRVGLVGPPPAGTMSFGNLLSANGEDGLFLEFGNENTIGANQIGINPTGTASRGNGGHGIQLRESDAMVGQETFIPGVDAQHGNDIMDNLGDGLRVVGNKNRIYANTIALNAGDGIHLDGTDNQIGFVNPLQINTIVSNGGFGVRLGATLSASDNIIENQLIAQNGLNGIELVAGTGNVIKANQIAGNADGIRVFASNNEILNNSIGLIDGVVLGNRFNGVSVLGSGNILRFNVLGGMSDDGIDVVAGTGHQILNNQIGTLADGTDIGNTNVGIRVRSAANDTLIQDNRIGHNADGIALEGSGTSICGNAIGLTESSLAAGNRIEGIRIDGGGNTVGNPVVGCAGNTVGFNASDGIQITGDANVVRGNISGGRFGLDLGNGNSGIFLNEGSDLNEVADNDLHHNGNDGIRVAANAGTRNRFDGNRFGDNGDISIDLGDNGQDLQDPQDTDSGPNNLQNSPQFQQIAPSNGRLQVRYAVDSSLGSSNYPLTVDFYISEFGGEQIYRIHRDSYTDPNRLKTVTFDVPLQASSISAMVIDTEGNSSELSIAQSYTIPTPSDEIFRDRFELP